ncbi:hypothetical protein PHLCEN_2v8222 [Hermanssonia centrifuga]|uniref:Alpha-L-arabinofuranosidase C-terminal domain-containing protein n=1 Tax=Hermanssonia centrifuga TaxID=98765 RepID=A0A2R6NUB8_9APHY|nr:hypothetical protein PHLCEN_2v8222 [Hermanssonia centrifuga]
MRGGISVRVSLNSPAFSGETLPEWISTIKGQPSILDASAVLHDSSRKSLRVAVVNRSETESYEVPIRVAFAEIAVKEVEVHELWHSDVNAQNGWGRENEVQVRTRRESWHGKWTFREHSFTLLVFELQ